MPFERQRGVTFSALLHLLLLLLMLFGLPAFMQPDPVMEPAAITVELLPITGVTNVKPADQTPQPKQDDPKKSEEKPPQPKPAAQEQKPEAKPAPPVKTKEATPTPPPPTPRKDKKTDEKKPEKKPEEKKPEKKEKKPTPDDLEAVLKAVKETASPKTDASDAKTDAKDSSSKNKSLSNKYDPTLPMSLSERDAIMGQIAKCWNVPAGAKDAHELVVILVAEYSKDGALLKVELANEVKGRYSRDSFFRAAADSAMRAVRQCSPLQGLPQDKFQTWRLMELRFDPKFMLQ